MHDEGQLQGRRQQGDHGESLIATSGGLGPLETRTLARARAAREKQRIGRSAERIAADFYEIRGFRILGTNIRLGALEIDVLARRGPLVVVVEVRARRPGAIVGAFASVTPSKVRLLHRAVARIWQRMKHDPTLSRVRVDVAAVDVFHTPVTVEIAEAVLSRAPPASLREAT